MSPLSGLMWSVYNAQGDQGGNFEAMFAAMKPLTTPVKMREYICRHIASKGFVSPIYIQVCMQAALDFLGGKVRSIEHYTENSSMPTLPNWNDYACFVQGAKFDDL